MVQPVYPEKEKLLWRQETVTLDVVVGEDGHVREVRAWPFAVNFCCESGEFLEAASAAVKQWIYKPYQLNGKAIRVRTRVTVNFVLDEHTSPLDVCLVLNNPDMYDLKELNLVGTLRREQELIILSSPKCRGKEVVVQSGPQNPNLHDGEVALRGVLRHHEGPGELSFTSLTLEKVLAAENSSK